MPRHAYDTAKHRGTEVGTSVRLTMTFAADAGEFDLCALVPSCVVDT
jgi:hypothetical protein